MAGQNFLSEIDAIFASKQPTNASSNSQPKTKKTSKQLLPKLKEKAKQPKESSNPTKDLNHDVKAKRKLKTGADEKVVIDPSEEILKKTIPDNQNAKINLTEDDIAFQDSRGKRARTDDGLPIYTVEELRIGLGGDTPECPFDCQCCF